MSEHNFITLAYEDSLSAFQGGYYWVRNLVFEIGVLPCHEIHI